MVCVIGSVLLFKQLLVSPDAIFFLDVSQFPVQCSKIYDMTTDFMGNAQSYRNCTIYYY